jgi:hypothetical protein
MFDKKMQLHVLGTYDACTCQFTTAGSAPAMPHLLPVHPELEAAVALLPQELVHGPVCLHHSYNTSASFTSPKRCASSRCCDCSVPLPTEADHPPEDERVVDGHWQLDVTKMPRTGVVAEPTCGTPAGSAPQPALHHQVCCMQGCCSLPACPKSPADACHTWPLAHSLPPMHLKRPQRRVIQATWYRVLQVVKDDGLHNALDTQLANLPTSST